MTNRIRHLIAIVCLFIGLSAKTQSAKDVFSNSGIWQDYGIPVNAKTYPEFKGRLVNCSWSDIEIAPNVWDWTIFDQDINDHAADSMPIIFMVYTRMDAPAWIFSNGVPKVNETNEQGIVTGYSPYYLDAEYNFYFKRMVTQVREHVETMEPSLRSKIIGVQACFGSTGDQVAYKGIVPKQYEITDEQFDSLFKVYSSYYYNEYKNVNPKITILSNPDNNSPAQLYWLTANCPGAWTKYGTMAKGCQQNNESEKQSWLYDLLNKPWNGHYIKSRSEIVGQQIYAGWWTQNKYKEMFAIMCYCIYWGVDWPNETYGYIQDPKFDSSFHFFNKYAGQKVPGLAQNAVCALKDALDASDSIRFPSSLYGIVLPNNRNRFNNIANAYAPYGAQLQDVDAALGNEYLGFTAKGTNDVGWHLLPGNYERYLHQIDANTTSAGYWNIDAAHNDVMYGRFGRGFDLAKGKDALYFDVEKGFLQNRGLFGKYAVTVDVTYYDNGKGSFQLFYDARGDSNKASSNIICTDTKTWKKATFTLTDARLNNKGFKACDFYIKNTGTANVVFSVVELSRPQQTEAMFVTTPLTTFDTVCQNSLIASQSFVVNAANLDGSEVKVGPLKGYLFSTTGDGIFTNTLSFSNYGNSLNYTVYVKIKTDAEGYFGGRIPVKGGGLDSGFVKINGSVLNTSPALNANVSTISCYNRRDGFIDLQPQGGIGPFTYTWTNATQLFWKVTDQDLSDLNVNDYTITVNSYKGCSVSKTFSITQPVILTTNVLQDSAIICHGGSTTVQVFATGGTQPYSGAGTFAVPAGFKTYTVTDARGCTDPFGYKVEAGLLNAPYKPTGIDGPTLIESKLISIIYAVVNPNKDYKYSWTVPQDATIVSGQNTSAITVKWGSTTGNVTVAAANICGSSPALVKVVKVSNNLNAYAATLPADDNKNAVLLLPNPVRNIATLRFNANGNWAYHITITDISGKALLIKKGTAIPGINTQQLNVQGLSAGTYLINITNEAGEKTTLKMIKQ